MISWSQIEHMARNLRGKAASRTSAGGEATLHDILQRLRPEQRQALANQSLFIIGHGRSGTTILQECFNLLPQVLLLGEPHIFMNPLERNFRERYNRQHELDGIPASKASYISAGEFENLTP